MSTPNTIRYSDPLRPLEKLHKEWSVWLQHRRQRNRLDQQNLTPTLEPVIIVVDDEQAQLNARYYEARSLNIPGRNMLLFKDAREAIAFIEFATTKKLPIAGVITDFDNGREKNGTDVIEAIVDYSQKLKKPTHKLLISGQNREFTPKIQEFNDNIDNAGYGFAEFCTKDNYFKISEFFLYMRRHMDACRATEQRDELIPELIHCLSIYDTLLYSFTKTFESYEKETPPGETRTIGEIYKNTQAVLDAVKDRIEDMLKIYALHLNWEGARSPNLEAAQPEEPINIRIMGLFFQDEIKAIRQQIAAVNEKDDWFSFSPIRALVYEQSRTANPDVEMDFHDECASQAVHNLRGMVSTLNRVLGIFDNVLKDYLKNPPQNLIDVPEDPDTFMFTHHELHKMIQGYRQNPDNLQFFYLEQKTGDRPHNTPGNKAPSRKKVGTPQTEAEKTMAMKSLEPIKPDTLDRYEGLIILDEREQAKYPDLPLATQIENLRAARDEMFKKAYGPPEEGTAIS